ncbi:ArsR/SmtB family transcription factor [Halorussus caseinilyticus]|uniref:ArsR/SmtB family transcription factor n=1 Tax=Halorussus caseinilyticus TaxID=3034025 RepID=A0ABD5WM07_9EURY|nr:helix-turn-helix domain-containing protein [Halorussus sp. DT72]
MADLLPSSPDSSAGDGGEPRVVGVDSDDADDLLAALQSETAREILGVLYDDPATPSTLADEADTSIQNARYHLDKLTDADLVEVADTVYSEKGREMKVYAPVAKPLVVVAGSDDDAPGVESALSRLLGALGVLGLSSLLVQRLFGSPGAGGVLDTDLSWQGDDAAAGTTAAEDTTTVEDASAPGASDGPNGDTSGTEAPEPVERATETAAQATRTVAETTQSAAETTRLVTEEAARSTTTVAESGGAAASSLPPGLVFFAGGVVVLLALGVARYLRER